MLYTWFSTYPVNIFVPFYHRAAIALFNLKITVNQHPTTNSVPEISPKIENYLRWGTLSSPILFPVETYSRIFFWGTQLGCWCRCCWAIMLRMLNGRVSIGNAVVAYFATQGQHEENLGTRNRHTKENNSLMNSIRFDIFFHREQVQNRKERFYARKPWGLCDMWYLSTKKKEKTNCIITCDIFQKNRNSYFRHLILMLDDNTALLATMKIE